MKTIRFLLTLFCVCAYTIAIAQTPVAYYPFTGNANDAIGTNNGTVNGATLTTDRFGNPNSAYLFDGVDDFISFPSSSFTAYSLSSWVKFTGSVADKSILAFTQGNTLTSCSHQIRTNEAGQFAHYTFDGAGHVVNGTEIISNEIWYHVVITAINNGQIKLYVNGIEEGTATDIETLWPGGVEFQLGSSSAGNTGLNNTGFLNGTIDDVKIFNIALTAEQILAEFNSNAPEPNYGSQFGNSVLMNGSSDFIDCGNNDAYNMTNTLTVEAWVKPASYGLVNQIIQKGGSFGPDIDRNGYQLRTDAANPSNLSFYISDNTSIAAASIELTNSDLNQWMHVAGVYNGSMLSIYRNGVLVNSMPTTITITHNSNPFLIGKRQDGFYFDGNLDEVRIWNTARSQVEIQNNMNSQLTGNEAGLVGYWNMNRDGQGASLTVDNEATATGAALNGATFGTVSTPVFEGFDTPMPANSYRSAQTGNWNNPAIWQRFDGNNWIVATAVPSSDDGTISIREGHEVTINDARTIDQTVVEVGGTLNLTGGSITVNDGVGTDLLILGVFNFSNGTFNGNGQTETNSGSTFNWSGGTLDGSGSVTVAGEAFFLNTTKVLRSKTLLLQGNTNWTSGSLNIGFDGNLTIDAGSTFTANSNESLALVNGLGGTASFTNNGTIEKIGTGSLDFQGNLQFDNAGAFEIENALINFSNPISNHTGTIDLGDGTQLTINTGTHTFDVTTLDLGNTSGFIQNSGTVIYNGSFTGTGLVRIAGGNFQTSPNLATLHSLEFTGGTINNASPLTINSTFNWSGGTLDGSGSVTVAGEAFFLNTTKVLRSKTLLLQGNTNWTSGSLNIGFDGNLTIDSGSTFTANSNQSLALVNGLGGTASFTNNGTIEKIGTGSLDFQGNLQFDNAGTFEIENALINFSNPISNHTGTIDLGDGTQLTINTGTHTFDVTTLDLGNTSGFIQNSGTVIYNGAFTGTGNVRIAGGNFQTSPNLATLHSLEFTGGTINNASPLTINSTFNWSGGTLDGSGSVTVAGEAFFLNTTKVLRSKTLLLQGNTNWTSGSLNIGFDGNLTIDAGSTLSANSNQSLALVNGLGGTASFTNNGTIEKIGTGSLNFQGNLQFNNAGKIQGIGNIALNSSFSNNGSIAPGINIGVLTLNGAQPLSPASTLEIEIQDNSGPGTGHDQLARDGALTLAGTLNVSEIGSVPGDTYTIAQLSSGTISGSFSAVNLPAGYSIEITSNAIILTKIGDPCENISVPVITADALQTCPDGTVVLSTEEAVSYLWSNGATTQTVEVGPGTYTVSTVNEDGCVANSEPLEVVSFPIDDCGICYPNGEEDPNWNTTCLDCAGEVNGGAEIDLCGICSGGNTGLVPNATCADCANVPNGTAGIDECGLCTGGSTGLVPNASCADCAGVPNGTNLPGSSCELNGSTGTYNESCTCIIPLPDYAVQDISADGAAYSPGQVATVTWTVSNLGESPAPGQWTERIFIENTNGQNRTLVKETPFSQTDPIAAGGNISRSDEVSMPQVFTVGDEGRFVVQLVPIAGVSEMDGANNTAVQIGSWTVNRVLGLTIPLQITEGGTATASVSRSGSNAAAQVVNIEYSSENRLSGPATVTILAGQSARTFEITATENNLVEGPIVASVSATAVNFAPSTGDITIIDNDTPSLSIQNLPSSVNEGDEIIFQIETNLAPTEPLQVFLGSSSRTRFPVPVSVTIPAGELSVEVSINVPSNDLPELDVETEISVSAAGHNPATGVLILLDDDIPGLELVFLTDTISEGGGVFATKGILRRAAGSNPIAFTANLSAGIPNTLLLPTSISLGTNESEKSFDVGVVDNSEADGFRNLVVTAALFINSCGCNAPSTSAGFTQATLVVADNDGPALTLSATPLTLREGLENAGTLRISRNTATSEALTINLISDNTNEVTLPATVSIPAGSQFVEVPITTIDDGVTDGNQQVFLRASATGFSPGVVWVIVTDENRPDLQIIEAELPIKDLNAQGLFSYGLNISNTGFASAPEGVIVRGYLSKNNTVDNSSIQVTENIVEGPIAVDQIVEILDGARVPNLPGEWKLIFRVNPGNTINELLFTNNTSQPIDISISPDFTATANVENEFYFRGDRIPISGNAIRSNGTPAANEEVEIYVLNQPNGQRREFLTTTDASGNFTLEFVPLTNESGSYVVGASFPGITATEAQDSFDILGVEVNNGDVIEFLVTIGTPLTGELSVRNLSVRDLPEFTLQPLTLPSGAVVEFETAPVLEGNATIQLPYSISSTTPSSGNRFVPLVLGAISSLGELHNINANYFSLAPGGSLISSIDQIKTSASTVQGETLVEFSIQNVGSGETGAIQVVLPEVNWLSSLTPISLPSLRTSEGATITLRFSAVDEIPFNVPVNSNIVITQENGESLNIPFTFQKVSSANGELHVNVSNQFTYFAEGQPKVEGAAIQVRNFFTDELYAQGITDENGFYSAEGIPEGKHRIIISKDRHITFNSTVRVNPGVTNEFDAFLVFQAVVFSWNVIPTGIEDNYEIKLVSEFQTNVPVPVVTVSVPETMPAIQGDEIFAFNAIITNHGLIRATNVSLQMPFDPEYEFLHDYTTADLMALQSISVPIIMRRRSGDINGGNSNLPCVGTVRVEYSYKLAADLEFQESTFAVFSYSGRNCGSADLPDLRPIETISDPCVICPQRPQIVQPPRFTYTSPIQCESGGSVCASVTIEVSQQLTMTREAFEGTLSIFNGHPTDLIENLLVNVEIRNQAGVMSNGLFQIETIELNNLSDATGTGSIPAQENGSVKYLFIPTVQAAPEEPVEYSFGGSITYFDPFAQATVTLPLSPISLTVNPSPDLFLHYFLERNILSDDPLTLDVIEPTIPAELAVMVQNSGFGPAVNMTISSAQPEIIENEQGLAIDFKLIGSNFQGQPANLGVTNINFGTIPALETRIGQWYLTSSLLGKFVSFEASVVHSNSFGNPELSLIEGVTLHELTRSIVVYGEQEDGINDFLVNDVSDAQDIPDVIYLSQGFETLPVLPAESGSFNLSVQAPSFTNILTVIPQEEGWNFIKLDDPGNGLFDILSVTRSDGQVLPIENTWLTFVTLPLNQRPIYENKFHFVDNIPSAGPTTYTVTWTPKNLNVPEVVSITGLPDGVSGEQITNLTVTFSKPIDPASFDFNDLTLVYQGSPVVLDERVVITQLSPESFDMDLAPFTLGNGFFLFTVQAAGVTDIFGINGSSGRQVSWNQAVTVPAVLAFEGLPENNLGNSFDRVDVLFNLPVDPATVTPERFTVLRDGIPQAGSLVIESIRADQRLYNLSGLGSILTTDGTYELVVDVTNIETLSGISGTQEQSVLLTLDTQGPKVLSLTAISQGGLDPQHRNFVEMQFDEPVFGFTIGDVVLRRNGEQVILNIAQLQNISQDFWTSGNFQLETYFEGDYTFTINLAGITDALGNTGTGIAEITWTVDRNITIDVSNLGISPDLGVSSSDGISSQLSFDAVFDLNEEAAQVRVSQVDFGSESILVTLKDVPAGSQSIPVTFPTGGNTSIRVTATDRNGETASDQKVLFLDLSPLNGEWRFANGQQLDSQLSEIGIDFSDPLLSNDPLPSALSLRRNGQVVTGELGFTQNDELGYTITGIDGLSVLPGNYELDIDLSLLNKLSSGISGNRVKSVTWTVLRNNLAPIANAGADQIITVAGTYVLDGTGSSDPEGDELSYEWTAPTGIVLSNSTSPIPSFTVNESNNGSYTILLIVSDGEFFSTDKVNILVDISGEGSENAPVPNLEVLPDLESECVFNFGSLIPPTATANDGSIVNGTTNESIFPISQQGTTVIIWTYTDSNGLASTQSQNIVIRDITSPEITHVAELILSADQGQCFATGFNLGSPIVTDNCGISSVVNDAPGSLPVGLTEVLWTVTDVGGNTAQFLQTVTVEDNEAPQITAPANITIQLQAGEESATDVELGTPTTSDNCGVADVSNDAPASFPIGTTTVTWTVSDDSGNTATDTQSVTVLPADTETELPTVTAPVDILVDTDKGICEAMNVDLGIATFTGDIPDGGLTNDAPNSFPLGENIVTWTVTDRNGNSATAVQKVTVRDRELPDIKAPANLVLGTTVGGISSSEVDLGEPEVSDNCSIAELRNNAPAVFPIGTTTVTWTVIDGSGNECTAKQRVTVNLIEGECELTAKAKPVLTLKLNSQGKARLNPDMADDGSTASCGPLKLDLSKCDFTCEDIGENSVKLIAKDAKGNRDEVEFKVIVVDESKPKIKVDRSAFVWMMKKGDTFTMPDFKDRVEASDNCGFELHQCPEPGTKFRKPENSFVEFEAKDPSGNKAKDKFKFNLLVFRCKVPNKNGRTTGEQELSDMLIVPWNTPFDKAISEGIVFEEGSDPEYISMINWQMNDYDPLRPGMYRITASLENEGFVGWNVSLDIPVIVLDKPLAEDIMISRNKVSTKVRNGEIIGSLNTLDPVDDIHSYSMDEHPDFYIEKNVLVWRGSGTPDAEMTVTVHSTDRAGQTISREITLYREHPPGEILIYPNPGREESNILVQLSGPGKVEIRIFDATGRLVYEEKEQQEGSFVRNLDLRGLSSGMYQVIVNSGNEVMTGRLVKE